MLKKGLLLFIPILVIGFLLYPHLKTPLSYIGMTEEYDASSNKAPSTLWASSIPLSAFFAASDEEEKSMRSLACEELSLSHRSPIKDVEERSTTPSTFTEYPWKSFSGSLSPLTKDYFRCRGSQLNPPIPVMQDGKVVNNIFDCRGSDSHSLPLRHEKEFVYPILIELLNYLQRSLSKPVIITSGHRCPIHNKYVDNSMKNSLSKHLIGAEVNFYVQGMEKYPQLIISTLEEFYKTSPRYSMDRKEYVPFTRFEKETDVTTKPWMNKEIFIKYFLPSEGRNGDNRHPYPYFTLQVRFDRERQLKVAVNYQEVENYLRY